MKYLLPALTLLAACNGEVKDDSKLKSVEYNLPTEIHQRTLQRSSKDGFVAAEYHVNEGHNYVVIAAPAKMLTFTAWLTDTATFTPQILTDFVNTQKLDHPAENVTMDQLYRLLLWEQEKSLDDNEAEYKKIAPLTNTLLKNLENK